jgi:hypothetical protein
MAGRNYLLKFKHFVMQRKLRYHLWMHQDQDGAIQGKKKGYGH